MANTVWIVIMDKQVLSLGQHTPLAKAHLCLRPLRHKTKDHESGSRAVAVLQ